MATLCDACLFAQLCFSSLFSNTFPKDWQQLPAQAESWVKFGDEVEFPPVKFALLSHLH